GAMRIARERLVAAALVSGSQRFRKAPTPVAASRRTACHPQQARPSAVDALKVRNAADVEEVVRAAIASEQPLDVIGHGSKRQIGQVTATNAVLDLSALNAVVSYEPNELIITAQAGAPLAD